MKIIKASIVFWALLLSCFVQAQNQQKEWTFFHSDSHQKLHLKQGQNIAVKWQGTSGTKISKGQLADISNDSLSLSFHNRVLGISKKDIKEITTNKHRVGAVLLSAILVLGGVFLAGFFILGQLIYNSTRTDYQLARGETRAYWPWSFLGFGLIALGFITLKSLPSKAKEPFSNHWTQEKKTLRPENQP